MRQTESSIHPSSISTIALNRAFTADVTHDLAFSPDAKYNPRTILRLRGFA
jgi:hypothetical protein